MDPTPGVALRGALDNDSYEELRRDVTDTLARAERRDSRASAEAESVVFHEAALLDLQRYEQWLDLFAPACMYWIPINPRGGDPRSELAITLDDRRRLEDRIFRLRSGVAWSQSPPSRTRRIVSNVEAWPAGEDDILVRSGLAVWDFRRGELNCAVATQVHRLTGVGAECRIRSKTVSLVNSDSALGNLSFVL
jgi:benzoate/toluate 1,2-dioxygenase beta subunit